MSHARLSPSDAKRWMACPGSIAWTQDMIDGDSVHAQLGTDAHEIAALCLMTNTRAHEHLGRKMGNGNVVDAEMVEHVDAYCGYVLDIPRRALLVERYVDLSAWYGEPGGGTADAIIVDGDTAHIVDLKYGKGVEVYAENNPQLRLYALGALRVLDQLGLAPKSVTLHIAQPRIYNWSSETLPVTELLAWGETVAIAAAATRERDAPRIPGPEQCRWCKGKATCPEQAAECYAVARIDPSVFPVQAPPAPTALADEQIDRVLRSAGMIQDWIKAVQAEAHRRVCNQGLAGWKLVAGKKGNRAWSDVTSAALQLQSAGLTPESIYRAPELLSPAQIEKLIGKPAIASMASFITQPDGAPAIAPASDKRPAITASVEADAFLTFGD